MCSFRGRRSSNCSETAINLQLHLNAISSFYESSGMVVNENKTEKIVFRNKGPLRAYENWFFNSKSVNVTNYYKYMAHPAYAQVTVPCVSPYFGLRSGS